MRSSLHVLAMALLSVDVPSRIFAGHFSELKVVVERNGTAKRRSNLAVPAYKRTLTQVPLRKYRGFSTNEKTSCKRWDGNMVLFFFRCSSYFSKSQRKSSTPRNSLSTGHFCSQLSLLLAEGDCAALSGPHSHTTSGNPFYCYWHSRNTLILHRIQAGRGSCWL